MPPFGLVIGADPSKRCTGLVAIDPHADTLRGHASIESDTRDDAWLARLRANVIRFATEHGAETTRTLFVVEQFDTAAFHLLGRGYSNPTAIAQILRADGVVREAFGSLIVRRRIDTPNTENHHGFDSVSPKEWRAAEGIKQVKDDKGKRRTVTPSEYKPWIEATYKVKLATPDEAAALAVAMFSLRRARVAACDLFKK